MFFCDLGSRCRKRMHYGYGIAPRDTSTARLMLGGLPLRCYASTNRTEKSARALQVPYDSAPRTVVRVKKTNMRLLSRNVANVGMSNPSNDDTVQRTLVFLGSYAYPTGNSVPEQGLSTAVLFSRRISHPPKDPSAQRIGGPSSPQRSLFSRRSRLEGISHTATRSRIKIYAP